jgi:OmpA-OmpF porin, OOP family
LPGKKIFSITSKSERRFQHEKNLDTRQNLADWVEAVFLAKVEKKAEVVPPPKPGDSDGDDVTGDIDQCSNTPMGAPVNDRGCWLIDNIYFDFDKSDLKPEFFASLVQIADVMKQNSDIAVQIGGHTDNLGFSAKELRDIEKIIIENQPHLLEAWDEYPGH